MVRTQGLVTRFVFLGGGVGICEGDTRNYIVYIPEQVTHQYWYTFFVTFVLVRNIVDYSGKVAKTREKFILLIMVLILERKGIK